MFQTIECTLQRTPPEPFGLRLKDSGDKKGMTPTSWAKKHNRTEILSLLLESGAPEPTEPRRTVKESRRPVKPVAAEP